MEYDQVLLVLEIKCWWNLQAKNPFDQNTVEFNKEFFKFVYRWYIKVRTFCPVFYKYIALIFVKLITGAHFQGKSVIRVALYVNKIHTPSSKNGSLLFRATNAILPKSNINHKTQERPKIAASPS